jgi:hypothetical protein
MSGSLPVKVNQLVDELCFADLAFGDSYDNPALRTQVYSRFLVSRPVPPNLV